MSLQSFIIFLVHYFTLNYFVGIHAYRSEIYCKPNLCDSKQRHIACHNDGSFHKDCKHPKILTMTNESIEQIVDDINSKRNMIASGIAFGFKPAMRMATIRWDHELAKLAKLSVKRCSDVPDKCRNTREFQHVGQIISNQYIYPGLYPKDEKSFVKQIISKMINSWSLNRKHCNAFIIASFRSDPISNICAPFAQLVQDHSTHVGCSLMRTGKSNLRTVTMACNFAHGNIVGRTVYQTGRSGKNCLTGQNFKYKYLCNEREPYDVNRIG